MTNSESSRFAVCLAFVLQAEGGFVDNPADPGGATMHGVTQAVYDAYRAKLGLDPRSVALIADNVSGCGRLCTGGGSAAGALLQSAVADAPRCAYCGIWRPVLRRRRRRCWRSPRRPSPTPSASARSCAGRSRCRNMPQ